jgi:hypothetical protein
VAHCTFISPFLEGFTDPTRIDFPNNVSVYRGTIVWDGKGGFQDDDYTMNVHSSGGELYDTQASDARVHIEFDSDESIDHFTSKPGTTEHDFGAANSWWQNLRNIVDTDNDGNVRSYMRSFVGPACPQPVAVQPCHDPMAVVVGVPSLDCADHPDGNTAEIHPAYAVAIRIQENPNQPELWTFFYRTNGNNGGCGSKTYGPCRTTFKLPLGFPGVPAGKVLKDADVQPVFHSWAVNDSSPSVTVVGHFDLANGTVLTITFPGGGAPQDLGVVGIVQVSPVFDTTPPRITCPANISKQPDLGTCAAVTTFAPTFSDDCLVSAVCSPPSGMAFPLGTTTDTCTATDQAGLSASCSFTVTVTAGNRCPLGEGYWKNHTDLWAVSSLTLGSVTYSRQQLISILDTPVQGDASVILAKQLITALLNLANGSNPAPICSTIADANHALGSCTVPCDIAPDSPSGQTMIGDANALDSYNGGGLTPGCTP